jgi:hypothetical protein
MCSEQELEKHNMPNGTLQASDMQPRSTLVMSPQEATVIARRDPDGWFIAGRWGKFIVGKCTAKGAWQVISSMHQQPIVFSAVELAHAYLRGMGIERPRRLIGAS